MSASPELKRLSLNQITTNGWTLPEAVIGCKQAGLSEIGLWREKVHAYGLQESARLIAESGLHVSSLCRGGWFPATNQKARQARISAS